MQIYKFKIKLNILNANNTYNKNNERLNAYVNYSYSNGKINIKVENSQTQ